MKYVNAEERSYSKYAPKLNFWIIWHNNIGKIDENANEKNLLFRCFKSNSMFISNYDSF